VTPLPHARDACQTHTDLRPLEGHHDLLFRSAVVEKDEYVGLRKVRRTHFALNDLLRAAMSEIRGETAHITSFIRL
jgi:hypothetical protein